MLEYDNLIDNNNLINNSNKLNDDINILYNKSHINNYNDTLVYYDPGSLLFSGFIMIMCMSGMLSMFVYFSKYILYSCKEFFTKNNALNEIIDVENLNTIIIEKNTETCSICLEYYDDKDIITKLQCEHMFHKDCIKPWFNSNNKNCPLCRRNI